MAGVFVFSDSIIGRRINLNKKLIIFVALLTLAVSGCSWFSSSQPAGPAPIVDDYGREVVLEGPALRVITLEPASTEIVFALGFGDRLVGATEYSDRKSVV